MRTWLPIILLLALSPHALGQLRTEVWAHRPIPLTLPVGGQTTVVHLPAGTIIPGLPRPLLGKVDVYPVDNKLYLKAQAPFHETMIAVRYQDSEREYLINLQSVQGADQYDLRIVDSSLVPDPEPGLSEQHHRIDVNKLLVRHASQSLYAPQRLKPASPHIRPAPVARRQMQARERVSHSESASICAPTGNLTAQPVASWRSGSTFVTAVRLENTGPDMIRIDPRGCHLDGDFITATAQHSLLFPKYKNECSEDDPLCTREPTHKHVTTMYYTSSAPFWEVVRHD